LGKQRREGRGTGGTGRGPFPWKGNATQKKRGHGVPTMGHEKGGAAIKSGGGIASKGEGFPRKGSLSGLNESRGGPQN